MNTHLYKAGRWAVLAAAFLWPAALFAQNAPPDLKEIPTDDVTVQARGPIHEAYAQPTDSAPQAGPIIPKQPPDPVVEQPPDEKPQGDNVVWIPGYWTWDSDRSDFTWVSGFWRVPPPDRKWVPGHWAKEDGGWEWIAGFWAPAAQDQVQYLNAPPDSLDNGPSTPAPDDNSIYVPGAWLYNSSQYNWRPGYWTNAQPGYVWTPAQYVYTPAGYVFVNGYWDYPLEDRGLLFAPVSFAQPFWSTPGWFYRPRYYVPWDSLLSALWVRPFWSHYYFGDYYGVGYSRLGFQPWFAYGRRHYDPLFSYYGWQHRGDRSWYRGLVNTYQGRVNGDLPRLPRTFAEQNALIRNGRNVNANALSVVRPLSQAQNNLRLTRLNSNQVASFTRQGQQFRDLQQQRQGLERAGRPLTSGRSALSLTNVPTTGRTSFNSRSASPLPRPQARDSTPAESFGRSAPVGRKGSFGNQQLSTFQSEFGRNGSAFTNGSSRSNFGSPEATSRFDRSITRTAPWQPQASNMSPLSNGGRSFSTPATRSTAPSFRGMTPSSRSALPDITRHQAPAFHAAPNVGASSFTRPASPSSAFHSAAPISHAAAVRRAPAVSDFHVAPTYHAPSARPAATFHSSTPTSHAASSAGHANGGSAHGGGHKH